MLEDKFWKGVETNPLMANQQGQDMVTIQKKHLEESFSIMALAFVFTMKEPRERFALELFNMEDLSKSKYWKGKINLRKWKINCQTE